MDLRTPWLWVQSGATSRFPNLPLYFTEWSTSYTPRDAAPVSARFAHVQPGRYRLRTYRTGYRHNDAYSAYIDMKLPETLSAAQLEQLQGLTRDLPERDVVVTVPRSGFLKIEAPMRSNDILLMRLERIAR